MARLAATISGKLNRANGPTRVMIPMKGFSEADAIGAPLYEPITNQAFLSALKSGLNPEIEVIEVNAHINDAEFAEAAVSTLNSMMRETVSRSRNIDS